MFYRSLKYGERRTEQLGETSFFVDLDLIRGQNIVEFIMGAIGNIRSYTIDTIFIKTVYIYH